MDNPEIAANEEVMEESAFATPSLAESEMSMAEKMQKFETELVALRRENVIRREQAAPTMMQIGWQIGEKFCKLEMKVAGHERELAGFRGENKELRNENGKLMEEIAGLKAEMAGKGGKLTELRNEVSELRRENGEFKRESLGNKRTLQGQIDEMKTKMARLQENRGQSSSREAIAVAQGTTNLIADLNKTVDWLEKEFLAFLTNSNALKHNKWEKGDCGLKFSEDALAVISTSKNVFNTVSAEFPIRLFNIVGVVKQKCVCCYFEIKLLSGSSVEKSIRIGIGYCGQEFPSDGVGIGGRNGSIGLYCTEGMSVDGNLMRFEETDAIPIDTHFRKKDIVGCGLLYSPDEGLLRAFATFRGTFLGSVRLPPKFCTILLYPAASLYFDGESFRANFGAMPFLFNPNQLVEK